MIRSSFGTRALVLGVALSLTHLPSLHAQTPARFDDYKNMLDQLGIKSMRRGANPNDQSTFDESKANPYKETMPDVLRMQTGERVTRRNQWPRRRAEIAELFEREVYGRIPSDVPKVTWEVKSETKGNTGGVPTLTRNLMGHVDNSAYPQLTVDIQASYTVPANVKKPVPMMIEFSFPFGRPGAVAPWQKLAISKGWGYGSIIPTSIQPDNNRLTTGIIGLTNKGQPRKPEQWGALRAWAWGMSRLIDYFEQTKSTGVDAKRVGIAGLSRYGKAAIVAQAFDERVAVGLIGSSGAGGAKLHRHIFGEAVENLTGGEYYWFAGNFIKYGASEPTKTAADIPVDAHQLVAMCAPRPCFISYGIVERGDAKWVDAHGSFMAGVLAGPVYRLLGKKDFGTTGDYLADPMPPVGTLIGGELAWRQHEGGHDITPNWPSFFHWVGRYIKAPEVPKRTLPIRFDTETASPRFDPNSMTAHRQLVEKAKKGGIDLYFLGDSIVRRWGTSDAKYASLLANWTRNFYGWNAGNFGWGADRVENILWRIENGELDGVNPKVIVLLGGTNNIGGFGGGSSAEEIAAGLNAVITTCKSKAPNAVIILTAIFPRSDSPSAMALIDDLNLRLRKAADGRRVVLVNINASLADEMGKLKPGMMEPDGLHPTEAAYQIWADALKPVLTRILGPRAATDHAPPPTGDPSANGR